MIEIGLIPIFVACFAPSLAFAGYIALKDRYKPEPLRFVLGVFAGGVLAATAALVAFDLLARLEHYTLLGANIGQAPDAAIFAFAFGVIGPIEEVAKFIVVWGTVYRFRVIAEPVDGIVYAAAAALGFATFENWYAMVSLDEVIWSRALTLPFNHVLFSSAWGYALAADFCRPAPATGRPRAERLRGAALVAVGLALSIVYHGLYDYIVLSEVVPHYLALPIILFLWIWMQLAIKRALQHSPFRPPSEADGAAPSPPENQP